MTKMNWAKFRQRQPDPERKALYDLAMDRKRYETGRAYEMELYQNSQRRWKAQEADPWPRTVTTGPLINGCLQVFTFQTPQEAQAAGYGWITRD